MKERGRRATMYGIRNAKEDDKEMMKGYRVDKT